MKNINLNISSHNYNIAIGYNNLNAISNYFKGVKKVGKILTLVDSNVYKYHKKDIDSIARKYNSFKTLVIKTDESLKSFRTLEKIFTEMVKIKLGRDGMLVSIGGGILGDVAGFAAGTFMRGIKYINIPTTLLSMVDSSVGGKTGINFSETKNVIGVFHQPDFVLVNIKFLNSLPKDEILSGYGEIIKYGFLAGDDLLDDFIIKYDDIVKIKSKILEKIIYQSLIIKSAVVKNDEKEQSLRKVLNLGHTFAHSFEVVSEHKIKHGQAVMAGIISAIFLSHRKGIIKTALFNELLFKLDFISGEINLPVLNKTKLYNVMLKDKKNMLGSIKFVLPEKPGTILLDVDASREEVFFAIEQSEKYFGN